MNIEDLLSIHKCNCGRDYCDFFAPGVGEWGESYSKKEVKKMLRDAKKLVKVLEKELGRVKKPAKDAK